MANRTYYTVLKFDTDAGIWCDEAGHYSKADAAADLDALNDGTTKRKHLQIVKTDGSRKALQDVLDTLNKGATFDTAFNAMMHKKGF